LSRISVVIVFIIASSEAVIAQPCNPAIDGTYCASQSNGSPTGNSRSNPNIGGDFSATVRGNNPAMLGAITFQSDGTRCMGLLRRSNCS